MARKSNKTDHVLSLLSNGGKDKAEKSTAAPKPPVEPDGDISTVSIVQSSSEKEGLAEKIKKSLEEEMDKMAPETADEDEGEAMTEQMQALHEPDAVQETASVSVPEPELVQEPAGEQESAREPESVQEAEPVRESEPVQKAEPVREPEPVQKAEPVREPGPVQKAEPDQEPEQTRQDVQAVREKKEEIQEEFAYVNVMETLVKEKVVDYMKQFGNCTCSRCVADTTALALTQLPPKYVVINRETVSPLMNFYTKKYAGQITVEITKACIRVGEVPHHSIG